MSSNGNGSRREWTPFKEGGLPRCRIRGCREQLSLGDLLGHYEKGGFTVKGYECPACGLIFVHHKRKRMVFTYEDGAWGFKILEDPRPLTRFNPIRITGSTKFHCRRAVEA